MTILIIYIPKAGSLYNLSDFSASSFLNFLFSSCEAKNFFFIVSFFSNKIIVCQINAIKKYIYDFN